MSRPVKRAYDSSRRQAQARETRRRMVRAATELFVENGYAATTMTEVAEAADVAPQTLYAAFRSKSALLGEAVGVALAGDDEPVAVFDRPEGQAVLVSATAAEAAARLAGAATALLVRAGRLIHAADAAGDADPELERLRTNGHKARLTDFRRVARAFRDAGLLRPGIDVDDAADFLWVVASPDAYRAFTVVRGWSPRRYERWLADAVERTVLVDPPTS